MRRKTIIAQDSGRQKIATDFVFKFLEDRMEARN